jgi:hypothetical protein
MFKQYELNEQIKTSPQCGRKGQEISERPIFYTQVSMCVFVFVYVCVCVCVYVCTLLHS